MDAGQEAQASTKRSEIQGAIIRHGWPISITHQLNCRCYTCALTSRVSDYVTSVQVRELGGCGPRGRKKWYPTCA